MNYSKATRIVKWSTYSVSQQKRDADALMFLLLCSRKFSAVGKYNAPPLEKQTHRDALTVALWSNNMEQSFCSANLSDCVPMFTPLVAVHVC